MTAQPNALPLSPPEEERPEPSRTCEMLTGIKFARPCGDAAIRLAPYCGNVIAVCKRHAREVASMKKCERDELRARIAQLEADLAAARAALKDSYDRAYDLACVLNVERPSIGGASPHRFHDTDREIL